MNGLHLGKYMYSQTLIICTPLGSKTWYLVSKVLSIHRLTVDSFTKYPIQKQGSTTVVTIVIETLFPVPQLWLLHSECVYLDFGIWFWHFSILHF